MNKKDEQEVIRRKLRILAHVEETKNVSKTCRYWGISRDTFYRLKKEYKTQGEVGLINSKPCPENPSIRVAFVIEEKILYLRKNYHFASDKICWYLERYYKMKVSMTGVYGVLCRHGLNRLPHKLRRRQIKAIKRYEKKCLGITFRWMLSFSVSAMKTAIKHADSNTPPLMMLPESEP
ncbi:helix-turn-helix domain-containing protein [Arsenophonus nasoniae]|uniref:Helix-turn-helix domain-containing protein n=1 Tax=Arsenophonus nasoniae TaxID=638 RepID=A0AA95GD18_9GAMM|nr:helix-turn-helix domain-containing protein [Arsenophonus nasoniae]WGL94813.1 helix-turn-helix domain-containing protein [Arsenophonus nasoniae]